jgi:uncharacterized protein (DUF302 family)
VVIAGYAGGREAEVNVTDIIWRAATIRGFTFRLFAPQTVAAANSALLEFLKSGALQPTIDRIFPLTNAAEAVRRLIEDRPFGRVLMHAQQSLEGHFRQFSSLAASTSTTPEQNMTGPTVTQRVLQVEHIQIETPKGFADTTAALESSVPQLNPAIAEALVKGDEERAMGLERGAPLFIFLKRDHGALLQVTGQPRKAVQYEIGNPHTASKMTRHRLAAGLYAPLRVILREGERGGSIFEYDKPSSLFGQFDDEQVSAVARGLDVELENALRQAAE